MEESRPPTSKPSISSPSQPANSNIKSPTARPSFSSKLGDSKGRPSESAKASPTIRQPAGPPQRAPSFKNALTGRSQNPQQNNFNTPNRQSGTAHFRDGQRIRIVLGSGAEYEGIYANTPADPSSFLLRMVQQRKPSTDIANGASRREQGNMPFQRKDVVDARAISGNLNKAEGKTQNGTRSGFRTDAAIANNRAVSERTLQRWVPDGPEDVDSSLEKSTVKAGWDQFAENERLFGLKTDYDENMYTTAIDKSHPQYSERMAAAEKKAREIERTVPTTTHVAEERVMDFAGGMDRGGDEEDKYSGVRKQDFPPLANRENKYTPPARRAPTGQATVLGAPVDPAIISSQIKGAGPKKQPTPKPEENKTGSAPTVAKAPAVAVPAPETKPSEIQGVASKPEVKPEAKPTETKPSTDSKVTEPKANEKATPSLRPAGTPGRAISPQGKPAGDAPSATSTVEADVLKSFKSFASQQRVQAEKVRTNKIKADAAVKLQELKRFADSFKLSTPVPSDLISIIAKDPVKQKEIQERALKNAEEMALAKAQAQAKKKDAPSTVAPAAAAAATAVAATPTQGPAKPAAELPPVPNPGGPPVAPDTRSVSTSRVLGPQHTPSPSGVPGRHPGGRQSYAQQGYRQSFRNDRTSAPHGPQGHPSLAERIRGGDQNRYNKQAPHNHHYPQDMRLPPTGPANSMDANYGPRRLSGVPQQVHMAAKLNPNSHEFRPNAFAPPFNPNGPSAGSSPRSGVNNVVEPQPVPSPLSVSLVRRKTKAIDVKKCLILAQIKTVQPPPGRNWDDNRGLRPSYDTPPTWRQIQEDEEKEDSTMRMTWKEYFLKNPLAGPGVMATPSVPHVMPQMGPHPQLPFHMQHGGHNFPRQSPHMPSMPMHTSQHGHVPHVSFSSSTDDHRMVHSSSAQSFASPRLAQVSMYPPQMSSPAQMPYSQQLVPPFMPGTPQMNQYRSFSNSPQYLPPQPNPMSMPLMPPQQFVAAPNGMMPAGSQMPMYGGGHPQFMAPAAGPPPQQPIPGSNGYPSPGRPAAAPMMVQQGSQQGQPMYGMSPGMQYQQPVFTPQHPPGQVPMRGYSNPGPQQFGTSPQQAHQYGPPHRNGSGNYNNNKNFPGHNQHQGPPGGGHGIAAASQVRAPDGPEEGK